MSDDRTEMEAARQIGLERRREQRLAHLPTHLRGDGPCQTCGTENNIVWFTENAFWNAVVRNSDCKACFEGSECSEADVHIWSGEDPAGPYTEQETTK